MTESDDGHGEGEAGGAGQERGGGPQPAGGAVTKSGDGEGEGEAGGAGQEGGAAHAADDDGEAVTEEEARTVSQYLGCKWDPTSRLSSQLNMFLLRQKAQRFLGNGRGWVGGCNARVVTADRDGCISLNNTSMSGVQRPHRVFMSLLTQSPLIICFLNDELHLLLADGLWDLHLELGVQAVPVAAAVDRGYAVPISKRAEAVALLKRMGWVPLHAQVLSFHCRLCFTPQPTPASQVCA